jgi:hypothetical protein
VQCHEANHLLVSETHHSSSSSNGYGNSMPTPKGSSMEVSLGCNAVDRGSAALCAHVLCLCLQINWALGAL